MTDFLRIVARFQASGEHDHIDRNAPLASNQGILKLVERAGYALVPLDMHYTRSRIKVEIGLAKGKKQHDKRATEKEREWRREQQRLMRLKT